MEIILIGFDPKTVSIEGGRCPQVNCDAVILPAVEPAGQRDNLSTNEKSDSCQCLPEN